MGSGLFDYYRRPYKVHDAMKAVYTRVLISLERDAQPYIIGREKVYERGTTFTARVWVTNDFPYDISETQVSWQIVGSEGEVVAKNSLSAILPADSAVKVDDIRWPIPATTRTGSYLVWMKALGPDGRNLSTNFTEITVR
jgi:beta-mannosidase